ncbi:hypothetical protein BT69DRAFT_1317293 [Atractiella rhizophila]|nr:hypothetical protein BT69DRAFT_1317293 [Atractiella rhizophila]
MPRIPVRTEPYNSPSRQHRHFKNKRDQILRALGKAAYINGSQFAILWVSAQGKVETYASDLLQDKLDQWFSEEQVLNPAREIVLENQRRAMERKNEEESVSGLGLSMGAGEEESGDGIDLVFNTSTEDLGDESTITVPSSQDANSFLVQDTSTSSNILRPGVALEPIDSNLANKLFGHGPASSTSTSSSFETPSSAPLSITSISSSTPLSTTSIEAVPSSAISNPNPDIVIPVATTSINPSSGVGVRSISFNSSESVSVFLQNEFSNLQQVSCRIVAKLWIKVIEPKKQNRYPYQRGERSKPDWWPREIRHKEPDHLKKDERIQLLEAMLRSGRVPVSRLSLATAEAVAIIPATKMSILREIYKVAEAEEQARKLDPLVRSGFSVVLQNHYAVRDEDEISDVLDIGEDEYEPPAKSATRQASVARRKSRRKEPYSLRKRTKAAPTVEASPPLSDSSISTSPATMPLLPVPAMEVAPELHQVPLHQVQLAPEPSSVPAFIPTATFHSHFAPIPLEHHHAYLANAPIAHFDNFVHVQHVNPFLANSQFHNQGHLHGPQEGMVLGGHHLAPNPFPTLAQQVDWNRHPFIQTQQSVDLFSPDHATSMDPCQVYYGQGEPYSELSSTNGPLQQFPSNIVLLDANGNGSADHSPIEFSCTGGMDEHGNQHQQRLGAPFEYRPTTIETETDNNLHSR